MISTARAALVSILKGISAIGNVHAFERYSESVAQLDEWYRDGGEVNALFLRSSPSNPVQIAFGEQEQHVDFVLTWVKSVSDAQSSRQDFEDDVETVLDTLIAAHTLTGTVDNCTAPAAEPVDRVMLKIGDAEVLCDRVVIRFQAQKRAAVTYA